MASPDAILGWIQAFFSTRFSSNDLPTPPESAKACERWITRQMLIGKRKIGYDDPLEAEKKAIDAAYWAWRALYFALLARVKQCADLSGVGLNAEIAEIIAQAAELQTTVDFMLDLQQSSLDKGRRGLIGDSFVNESTLFIERAVELLVESQTLSDEAAAEMVALAVKHVRHIV